MSFIDTNLENEIVNFLSSRTDIEACFLITSGILSFRHLCRSEYSPVAKEDRKTMCMGDFVVTGLAVLGFPFLRCSPPKQGKVFLNILSFKEG